MVEDISVNFMGKLLNEGKREVIIGALGEHSTVEMMVTHLVSLLSL